MQAILKSTYTSILIVAILLLLLFHGIFGTYAYSDGYEFIWDSVKADFINVFMQQGRVISGWINWMIYPHINYISDLWKIRVVNLSCLFLSCVLILKMLKRNNINQFHALAIVVVFICSPFASIVINWEATSSTIWGYPMALLSGEIIFNAYLNKEKITKIRFNIIVYSGILFALISLFIYQPAYTAFMLPAFLHFITGQKRDVIWRFLLLHIFIYGMYFLLYKYQLNHLNIPADKRAGITVNPIKIVLFLKGVFIRSLYYNIIFASKIIQAIIVAAVLFLFGYFAYAKTKSETKKDKWIYLGILFMLYVLSYFPNFISADNFIAYRTMGTVIILSSFLLIYSITTLPLKPFYANVIISCVVLISITVAFHNNNTFTRIQAKEYEVVKKEIAEKLKQDFPKKVMVIMAGEHFLVEQNIINNIVTDEFGKLSNTVNWTPRPFVQQEVYELTGDKAKAEGIDVTCYMRNKLPADSIIQKNDWVLDIEKIYLAGDKAVQ